MNVPVIPEGQRDAEDWPGTAEAIPRTDVTPAEAAVPDRHESHDLHLRSNGPRSDAPSSDVPAMLKRDRSDRLHLPEDMHGPSVPLGRESGGDVTLSHAAHGLLPKRMGSAEDVSDYRPSTWTTLGKLIVAPNPSHGTDRQVLPSLASEDSPLAVWARDPKCSTRNCGGATKQESSPSRPCSLSLQSSRRELTWLPRPSLITKTSQLRSATSRQLITRSQPARS